MGRRLPEYALRMDEAGVEQHAHWDAAYERNPGMFGRSPSTSAIYAAQRFHDAGATRVLELGAGYGRDSLHFAAEGFKVVAMDYSATGLQELEDTAARAGLGDSIETQMHDVRTALPLPDGSAHAVYAHLLLCMALSTAELGRLVDEVGRVLVPGGVFVYTVRNTSDAHYGVGIDHGDSIFETQGYAVHFFGRALVDALAVGWKLEDVSVDEEGQLPRRLWRITQTTAII